MQFTFFILKAFNDFFFKNLKIMLIAGCACYLHHYDPVPTKIDMWLTPLNAIKYIHVFDITESFAMHWYWLCCSILLMSNLVKPNHELEVYITIPNGHILDDSPLIRHRDFTWKVRRNDIDFERRIHIEIITSIQHGNLDVDSTFKIDEILMSSPRGFFDVISMSNRLLYSLFELYYFLAFSTLETYSKLFWYSAELMTFQQYWRYHWYWNYWNYILWEFLQQRK